jgi:hypothetical protein
MAPSVSDSDDPSTPEPRRAEKRPRGAYDDVQSVTKRDLIESQSETAKLIMRSIGGAMQKLIDRAVDTIRVSIPPFMFIQSYLGFQLFSFQNHIDLSLDESGKKTWKLHSSSVIPGLLFHR